MSLAVLPWVCQSSASKLKERTMNKQRGFTLIELMVMINNELL
ncbi:prepilin-type N-terminal cleavage/methylation domain-containing protein [Citrobacter freundii]|nr:prepilin-type N-terminal cleavage/methylation domain-containing protein [Citrobacter freundii]MCY3415685.1 prepilin-type N-terminal cleavage/methylation domain-containing protein [Citrobacter freundii]